MKLLHSNIIDFPVFAAPVHLSIITLHILARNLVAYLVHVCLEMVQTILTGAFGGVAAYSVTTLLTCSASQATEAAMQLLGVVYPEKICFNHHS